MYMIGNRADFDQNLTPSIHRSHRTSDDRSPFNPVIVLRGNRDSSEQAGVGEAGSGFRPLPNSVSGSLLGSGFELGQKKLVAVVADRRDLRRSSIGFNEFSFSGVLTVCVKGKDFGFTKQVHCRVLVHEFLSNVVIASSIIDVYTACGKLGDSRRFFGEMKVRDVLAWTTLVSGYAKWGDITLARELFDAMPEKNSVSWTTLVSGYARNNMGYEALGLFTIMIRFRVKPDQFTFSSCMCACASIPSLKHGKEIHAL